MVDLTGVWRPVPDFGFGTPVERAAKAEYTAKLVADHARIEEAKTERERIKRGHGPKGSDAPRQLIGRSLAGVSMHAIEWLWTGWIPKGYVTLLAGETGAYRAADQRFRRADGDIVA